MKRQEQLSTLRLMTAYTNSYSCLCSRATIPGRIGGLQEAILYGAPSGNRDESHLLQSCKISLLFSLILERGNVKESTPYHNQNMR